VRGAAGFGRRGGMAVHGRDGCGAWSVIPEILIDQRQQTVVPPPHVAGLNGHNHFETALEALRERSGCTPAQSGRVSGASPLAFRPNCVAAATAHERRLSRNPSSPSAAMAAITMMFQGIRESRSSLGADAVPFASSAFMDSADLTTGDSGF